MNLPFSELEPDQVERLALLLEELGEAQQAIGKVLRHGYGSHHPDSPLGPDNRDMLERELGDVLAAIEILQMGRDVSLKQIESHKRAKRRRVVHYLHEQSPDIIGALG